jgi:AhpD family alkylhydroperoxidase
MQARIKNPAMILPEAVKAFQALNACMEKADLPPRILALSHLRASQINGCSFCIDLGVKTSRKAGESDERLFAVAAWRHTSYFTDAERAALALTEAVTRLSDTPDPVPDEIWNEAAKYFSETALAALLLSISVTNAYNRLNVATRQPPGHWNP